MEDYYGISKIGRFQLEKMISSRVFIARDETDVMVIVKIGESRDQCFDIKSEYDILNTYLGGLICVPKAIMYGQFEHNYRRRSIIVEEYTGIQLDTYIEMLQNREAFMSTLTHRLVQIIKDIHSRGIVHRDIKPSNFTVRSDGSIVCIDFGSSTIDSKTHIGIGLTEMYASDEALNYKQTSFETDWVSLAYTIYSLQIGIDVYIAGGIKNRPYVKDLPVYTEIMKLI